MKPARSLALRKDRLAELSADRLGDVHGAAVRTLPVLQCMPRTTPVDECLGISWEFTCLDCITRDCG